MTLRSEQPSKSSPGVETGLKLLVLDFDGVLWDSAGEVFEMAWRAYRELDGVVLDRPEDRLRFLAERSWARTGLDFYHLMRRVELAREGPCPELDEDAWQTLRSQAGPEAERFRQHFYRLRSRFRDSEFPLWLSFQRPYRDVLEKICDHAQRLVGIALATTKDADSAAALLSTTRLAGAPVYGREFSENKAVQVAAILERFGVEAGEALFVDDLIENLDQVTPLGVPCALASWGYNTEESRKEAEAQGYPVVTVEQFGHLLQVRIR